MSMWFEASAEDGYDVDLEIYEGLEEEIENGRMIFGDVAEDYGAAQAVNLISDGCIVDYDDHEITLRESRFPEAEMEYLASMDYSKMKAGEDAAFGTLAVVAPVFSGLNAVNSGGDPFWVIATGGSSLFAKDILKKSLEGLAHEAEKWKNSAAARKQYRLGDIDKEDFELDVMEDASYHGWARNLDPSDENLEVREMPKMQVIGVPHEKRTDDIEDILE